jgi:hypothetical protein
MMKLSHEQAVADVHRQMAGLETRVADLRSEQKALRDLQEADRAAHVQQTTSKAVADVQRQMAGLETHVADLQRKTLRHLHEADRAAHVQQTTSKAAMRADLPAELDGFDATACAMKMKSMEEVSRALTCYMDETRRMVLEFQQDSLTETKLLRGRVEAVVGARDDLVAQRAEVRKILDEDRNARALERRSLLERLQLVEQQLGSVVADRLPPSQVDTPAQGGSSAAAPASTEELTSQVTLLIERVSAAEASAHRAPLVAAQNLEVTRSLMENERRLLLDRIEPLEQRLPSAGALEAMAQRISRVEQQCSIKTAHPLGAAAADAAGGSTTLIPRVEALESACQALQHLNDKNAKNNLGMSLEAASTQQGFSQLRSSMEVLQELLQEGLAVERAERKKALQEAKQSMDECFEAVDCRLAGIANCRVSDTQSELSESRAIDRGYARRVGELDAELRAEMANRVRTLTMELRGEILGEVAVRVGSAEARMELLETRIAGDVKRTCMDLGIRIDHVEDQVNKSSKLVAELEEGKAAVDAIEAIERGIRGALQESDPKRGGKRPCSPGSPKSTKLALMRSASANGIIHKQHTPPAPVESNPLREGSSQRSNSTTDVDMRDRGARSNSSSVRLASSEHSNSSYRSLSAAASSWQSPMVPMGPATLNAADFRNVPDGVSPLSDGLKQSLQGLVSAVHRTFPKKDGSIRSAVGSGRGSARIPAQLEDGRPESLQPSTDGSSKPQSPTAAQQFRSAQDPPVVSHPVVTNQLDSEPSTTDSAARLGVGLTSGCETPSIMSRMLAQQRTSRLAMGSTSSPKSSALRPRISTMEVEPTTGGRMSPGLPSTQSSPARQRPSMLSPPRGQKTPLFPNKASLVERAQDMGTSWPGMRMVNGVMGSSLSVRQPDGVNYQPAQPRLSLSRYLAQ